MQILKWVPDGQFLTISRKITYARFAMTEIERRTERGNYLGREKFFGGKLEVFFGFCHFFSMKCFPDQNHLSPSKSSP